MTDHYDAPETRDPSMLEAKLFARLPAMLRNAIEASGYAEHLRGIVPSAITNRAPLATMPVLRNSDPPRAPPTKATIGRYLVKAPRSVSQFAVNGLPSK
jgi:phenylacetate-CoA ligase